MKNIILPKPNINEINCRSIINSSKIPDIDYCINPYIGCQHGCVYCFGRFMTRFSKSKLNWGSFVEVKRNAPEVLQRQIIRLKKGLVSLSTVTDPYQEAEKKYQLTRNILMILKENNFPFSILTKSNLVLRDIDILNKISRSNCDVGFSITTLDEEINRNFEPGAPAVKDRLDALKIINQEGIKTWVFIAPLLLDFTSQTILKLLNEIKSSVDYLLVDKLNIKSGNWHHISRLVGEKYPHLLSSWREILFSPEKRFAYYLEMKNKISRFCKSNQIEVKFC